MKMYVRATYMLNGKLCKQTEEVLDYAHAMDYCGMLDSEEYNIISVDIYHA